MSAVVEWRHVANRIVSSFVDADIVCARAKLHYVPGGDQGDLSESATQLSSTEADRQMESFRAGFKKVHDRTRFLMYFS